MDIYYYILHVTNLVAMDMLNFVNKLEKNVQKKYTPSPISTMLITDRHICYVCVGV